MYFGLDGAALIVPLLCGDKRTQEGGIRQARAEGDTDTARTLLRDVTNATLGFQALAAETGVPEKSLMRILGASGNPGLSNVGRIVRTPTKHAGVNIKTTVEPAPAAA